MPDTPTLNTESPTPSTGMIWWQTARPRTLPAVIGPIFLGQMLVPAEYFAWTTALLCLVCALSLQIAVNLANDLADGLSGVDREDRLGPQRALQSGRLSAGQLRTGLLLVLGFSVLTGLWLILFGHWLLWILGVASLLAALGYSGGSRPYANRALGEVAVWLFFGPVAVLGSLLAHQAPLSAAAIQASILVGLPVAAILVVNNLRDRFTDERAGKITLAVRLGRHNTRWLFGALTVLPVLLSLPLTSSSLLLWSAGSGVLLWSLLLQRALQRREGVALNPLLGWTAIFSLVFALWLVLRFSGLAV